MNYLGLVAGFGLAGAVLRVVH